MAVLETYSELPIVSPLASVPDEDTLGVTVGVGRGSTAPTRQHPRSISLCRGEASRRRTTTGRIANPVICRRKQRSSFMLTGTHR